MELSHVRKLPMHMVICIYLLSYSRFRRRPKAKAPLPPTDTKNVEVSSAEDSVESASFIMEQKENMIDRDIELSVVLPGDVIKSATVHGRYALEGLKSCNFPFFLHHC